MTSSDDFIEDCAIEMSHKHILSAAIDLAKLVRDGHPELELQKHIEKFPYLLSQQFTHCRHIAPNFSFGGRLVADFMCLDWPSSWPHWVAVEIEAPNKQFMTKDGRRSAKLEHALQQIRDWREFVKNNLDFVNRPRSKNGLGLEYAEPLMSGHIYIGRRLIDPLQLRKWNVLRSQIEQSDRISVFSWDGFVEHAMKRAKLFNSMLKGIQIDLGDGNPITLTPVED